MMEDNNIRMIHPSSQPKRNPLKDFLNKSPQEITVGDAFLMQAGNSLIAVLIPTFIGGLGVIFAKRRRSQETHGL